jgi:hypothetical protein
LFRKIERFFERAAREYALAGAEDRTNTSFKTREHYFPRTAYTPNHEMFPLEKADQAYFRVKKAAPGKSVLRASTPLRVPIAGCRGPIC